MNENHRTELSRIRLERAKELIHESEQLLAQGSFKSANNRAYYAIEKCLKALLAEKGVDAATHNGVLKQFNLLYVHQGDGTFTIGDYRMVSQADQIRNASDYDDFYIAGKDDTRQQVENAISLYRKVTLYLQKQSQNEDIFET